MTLLDLIAAKLQADPARWPDRRGDYHADCPYCGKPAKKGQTHFRISPDGLCYCQVCQAGTTLHALAQHLGIETRGAAQQSPQVEYTYYDANGAMAYQVVRYYRNGEKRFFQRHLAESGQMVNGMVGVDRVLYRLPELTQAIAKGQQVYVVEGEKDVEMLRMRGVVATTNVGGAGKWSAAYSETLRGADVIILPDNDAPGEQHAQQVRQSLHGIAKSARIVRLPNLTEKGDVSDWLAMGHTVAELQALVEEKAKPIEYKVDHRREGVTLRDLQHKVFDPERWIIESILPEGACLFAAKYKSKKSWLALAICLAIAMGGKALGRLGVVQGDVLYLDLEGRQQRIQKRTRAMLGVRQVDWPDNFHVYTKWSQGDEGLAEIEHWLMAHPNAAIVVIDVLASFRRPMQKHEEFYRYDRDTVDPINELAERYHVAIVLVHHFNKGKHDDIMDSITGSTGLPSAVNTMWGLRRDVNDSTIQILELRGRDLENEDPLALKWDFYLNQHVIEGNAAEVATSAERRAVLKVLADDQPRTPLEIAKEVGKSVESVKQMLRKLLNDGLVDKPAYGKYARVHKVDHSDHSDHSDTSDHSDHSGSIAGQNDDTLHKSDRLGPRVIGQEGTDHSCDHSLEPLQEHTNGVLYPKSDQSDRDSNGTSDLFAGDTPLGLSAAQWERARYFVGTARWSELSDLARGIPMDYHQLKHLVERSVQ